MKINALNIPTSYMIVRSLTSKKAPGKTSDRLTFVRAAKYNIGGLIFSLFDVSYYFLFSFFYFLFFLLRVWGCHTAFVSSLPAKCLNGNVSNYLFYDFQGWKSYTIPIMHHFYLSPLFLWNRLNIVFSDQVLTNLENLPPFSPHPLHFQVSLD